MLFDTSAWIRFYRKPTADWKAIDYQTKDFIKDWLSKGKRVFTTPHIIQEVLQGFPNEKDFIREKEFFSYYVLYELSDQRAAAWEAAQIYRKCTKAGYRINKPFDILIALTALKYDLPILHRDRDFDLIARIYPLSIVNPLP